MGRGKTSYHKIREKNIYIYTHTPWKPAKCERVLILLASDSNNLFFSFCPNRREKQRGGGGGRGEWKKGDQLYIHREKGGVWENPHMWSPTRTKGVTRCWLASAFAMLAFCLLLASFDSEGGESCIEREVALTMIGRVSSASSSCCISCRLTAMASAAKDVTSLALLFLQEQRNAGKSILR